MKNNSIIILIDTLQQKIRVLDQIIASNQEQKSAAETTDWDAFEKILDQKDQLIAEINHLDSGFQTFYDSIREEILKNRSQYAEEIQKLQEMISHIVEQDVTIRSQEQRNKKLIEEMSLRERKELKERKVATKRAVSFYQNAANNRITEPRFLDKKK